MSEFGSWWHPTCFDNKEDDARQAWEESALVSATIEEEIYDELEMLQSLVKATWWISVEDRLPCLHDGEVFYWCIVAKKNKSVREAKFNTRIKKFMTCESFKLLDGITHWRELPDSLRSAAPILY